MKTAFEKARNTLGEFWTGKIKPTNITTPNKTIAMAVMCRNVPNDLVIGMAADENLPGLAGQNFQTEYLSRKIN